MDVDRGVEALLALLAVGLVAGFGSAWVFRRFSNAAKMRVAVNHVVAHLLELRLFLDEPAVVMRTQRDLLVANTRLVWLALPPALIVAVPFALLLVATDAVFGRAPLQPGQASVITVQERAGAVMSEARLTVPDGLRVETPGVRIAGARQVSWRVRVVRAAEGEVRVACAGWVVEKSVSALPGLRWIEDARVIRWGSPVTSIAIVLPARDGVPPALGVVVFDRVFGWGLGRVADAELRGWREKSNRAA